VLEARDRVGGRMLRHSIGGGDYADMGAGFIGPTQDHIAAVVKELGIGTFPTYNSGNNVFVRSDGRRETFASNTPILGTAPADPEIVPDIVAAVAQLDSMASEIDVNQPWAHPNAALWDSQTLDSFVRQNSTGNKEFLDLVSAACEPIFGAEAREISLLYTLFYIASSGNEQNPGTFERNFNTTGGAQESRIVGGSQQIALRIAEQLGRRVVLKSPVRRIVQKGGRVTVESDRYTVKCKKVIVAIPPTLAGRIDYHPLLPPERDQLTQRYGQGTLTKVAAVYDKPFWRDKGLTGQAVSIDGLVSATFDDSPQSGAPGVIFGFVGGDSARTYQRMSAQEGRDKILGEFAGFFGEEARSPKDFFETRWTTEQWTRGCPVGIAGPGTLLAYGDQLRQPAGAIHWAGTETSTYWNGYMDGAVRSGERAAREALDAL
jgi:monoamine oxidase